MASGMARLGMIVADSLRRNRKITSTTSASVKSSVNSTSFTDCFTVSERSNRIFRSTEAGRSARKLGMSFFTASDTNTVFAPGCFWIASTTERLPRLHAAVLSFSTLSVTVPIWSTRTGLPLRHATTTERYAAASVSWPFAWMVYAFESLYSVPVGRLTLAPRIAAATSSRPMPRLASASGSTRTRTAYFIEPYTCTCATPFTVEMRSDMFVSANSSTV